jgi:hypothetical protein
MRNLVLVLVGLAVGAIAAANIINALRQRDAYPRGLMSVMQHQYAALRDDLRRNHCTEGTISHLTPLRDLQTDLAGAVYGDDIPDAPFREFDQRLHDALAQAPATCTAMAPAVDKIGAACDACHRQYR